MSDPVVLLSTGDVVGPAGGVTDNSMVLFSGTSGKLIKGNNAQVTSAGLALLDDLDANAQLTTLGLTTTQPQFDNSVKQATTEFVQRALGNNQSFNYKTASTVLAASEMGKGMRIVSATPVVITLPPVAQVPAGSVVRIFNDSNSGGVAHTVKGNAAEYIRYSTITSNVMTIEQGGSADYLCDGAGGWWVFGAVAGAALGVLPSFGSSLATNGYQKLPTGLIIQWGRFDLQLGSTGSVTFPIAYPNAAFIVVATDGVIAATPSTLQYVGATLPTTSGFSLLGSNGQAGGTQMWFSTGY